MHELTFTHHGGTQGQPDHVAVGYRAQGNAQPIVHSVELHFSVTDDERRRIQWYLEEYLEYPWGEFVTRARETEALLARLGEEFFDALFSDRETARLYDRVADDLAHTRVVVTARTPDGISLPWELLRDPGRGDAGLLAQQAAAFVRSQPDLLLPPNQASGEDSTLNILMVISRPMRQQSGVWEDDPVAFQSVARPLLALFREHPERVHLNLVRPPTMERLTQILDENPGKYHVLHFDGHGTFPEANQAGHYFGADGVPGQLLFEDDEGHPRLVPGSELGELLARCQVPAVILNACQSGMTRPESVYQTVANEILKVGTSGVVAMSYSVYVQTAVQFVARLYEGLLNGQELSAAFTAARRELRSQRRRRSPIGEVELQDWVVPVLFESMPFQPVRAGKRLHLDPRTQAERQATAGSEVGCPEPPEFGFVGRDAVIQRLERASRRETIILLEGMAGVGKTEAAAAFGRWLAGTGGLAGPIFFFSFEHYLPLSRVIDCVGQTYQPLIKEQLHVEWHLIEPEAKRELAVQLLRQVPCLLIWDNFEPVHGFPTGSASDWNADDQDELRRFLVALGDGATKVLLTSRRQECWLGKIYRPVPLGGLELREAQELAVVVLDRSRLSSERIRALPDYTELLKYLRGNPLAIRAILPELARTTPTELLAALQSGEATLPDDDPAQGRERSLAASLSYRLDRLDPELRQRLGVLALFQGAVDAGSLALMGEREDAPRPLAGRDLAAWKRDLDTAAELGLLHALGAGVYTIHPALPLYFHDLLREALPGHDAWLEAAYCEAVAELGLLHVRQIAVRTHSVLYTLALEEPNLRRALCLALRHKLWPAAATIATAVFELCDRTGRWAEQERLVARLEAVTGGLGSSPPDGAEPLWRAVLDRSANIALSRRELAAAQGIYETLAEDAAQHGDELNQASMLHQQAMVAQERRQFDVAERLYLQTADTFERLSAYHYQANSLHQLCIVAQLDHRLEDAHALCCQALQIRKRIGDELGQAASLHELGLIAVGMRRCPAAERYFADSLEITERLRDGERQAYTLYALGTLAHRHRQLDKAEGLYRQCLAIQLTLGDEHGQALTLHMLGQLSEGRGDRAEARGFLERAEAILVRCDDPHNLTIVRGSRARVTGPVGEE